MVAIPKPMLESLDLSADAPVELSLRGGKIVVAPRARRRYTLDELLAACDADASPTDEDRNWTAGARRGGELV